MKKRRRQKKHLWILSGVTVSMVCLCLYGWTIVNSGGWASLLLTPDQQGRLKFQKTFYTDAAETFRDPIWQATAWYRAGEFKKAAGIFQGFDTAEGAFNHGNALALQGHYTESVSRYERALALNPGWEDAEVNLAIARQQAERLERKGGEGTGGQLGADTIEFSANKAANGSGGEKMVEGNVNIGDAEMRAIWLRRVQTRPADFLKAKFAYQEAFQKETE